MKKYVFFIGGTGARVFRSFLHLCAAGVIRSEEVVTAVTLDVDEDNGDCEDAGLLYNFYQWNYANFQTPEVRKTLDVLARTRRDSSSGSDFLPFSTEIKLHSVGGDTIFGVRSNGQTTNLKTVVQASGDGDRALKWFYTEEECNQELDDGFFARPNIGSIFFQAIGNRFQHITDEIRNYLRNGQDVSAVIVGSMFGGTGAAGIPSVLRILEDTCRQTAPNALHISAVLITPYFKVRPSPGGKNIEVNSDHFFSNTKSALAFYDMRYRSRFEQLYLVGQDTLEYVSDDYKDGGNGQRNKPHILELVAALGVKNSWIPSTGFRTEFRQFVLRGLREPQFGWATLDEELSGLADMLRVHFILKTEIDAYVNGDRRGGKQSWFTKFAMDGEGQKLNLLIQYTDAFLCWMNAIQFRYEESSVPEVVPDSRITLVGPPLADYLSNDPVRQNRARKNFGALIDIGSGATQAQNVSYIRNKASNVLVDLGLFGFGAREKELTKLKATGLFIRLYFMLREKL